MPLLPAWPGLFGNDPSTVIPSGHTFFSGAAIANGSANSFTIPTYNTLTILAVGASGGGGAYEDNGTELGGLISDGANGVGVTVYLNAGLTKYVHAAGGIGGGTASGFGIGPGGSGNTGDFVSTGTGTYTTYTGTDGANGASNQLSSAGAPGGHDSYTRLSFETTFGAYEVFGGSGIGWSSTGKGENGGGGGGGPGITRVVFNRGDIAVGTVLNLTGDGPSPEGAPVGPLGGAGGQSQLPSGTVITGNAGQNGYVLIYWS